MRIIAILSFLVLLLGCNNEGATEPKEISIHEVSYKVMGGWSSSITNDYMELEVLYTTANGLNQTDLLLSDRNTTWVSNTYEFESGSFVEIEIIRNNHIDWGGPRAEIHLENEVWRYFEMDSGDQSKRTNGTIP